MSIKNPVSVTQLVTAISCGALFCGSADSLAQSSASSSNRLDEIIVTAEKRAESLQDISVSISAIQSDDLDLKNVVSVMDLTGIAPGFNVTRNEGFRSIPSIRGIGQEANQSSSTTPGVSYHIDGVYRASPFSMDTGFLDVQRIEVLRGPQGTVYGQNSIAGAINVIPNKPTFDATEGEVALSYGSYNTIRADAVLNVPLADNMALRAALRKYEHDGFTDNVSNGQELDDADNFLSRATFLWEPTDTFSATIAGDYFRGRANGSADKSIVDPTPGSRNVAQDRPARYDLDSWAVSAKLEWEFPLVTLRSTTSIQEDDQILERDNDRTDPAVVGPNLVTQDNADNSQLRKTKTQEFNILSNEPAFGKLDWQAGLFYLEHETGSKFEEYLDSVPNNGNFDFLAFILDTVQVRTSWSVFGQGTYHLSDTVRFVGGFRYSDEELERTSGTIFFNPATLFAVTDSGTTGKATLEWDVADNMLTYFSWSQGYRPGGINATSGDDTDGIPAITFPTFESEKVDSFEVGMKGNFLNDRFRANIAAFHYKFNNVQIMGTDPDPFRGGVVNLPKTETFGLEGEFTWLIGESLRLDLLASYLDTEITADAFQLDNVVADTASFAFDEALRAEQIVNLRGNELAKSPDITADLTLRHTADVGAGTLESAIHLKHRGEFYHRVFNSPVTDLVDSYTLLNLVFNYELENQPWDFSLSVYNLTDVDDAVSGQFTDAFGIAATIQNFVPPRQVIGRVRYRF